MEYSNNLKDGRKSTSEKNERSTGGSSSDIPDREKDFEGIALYVSFMTKHYFDPHR